MARSFAWTPAKERALALLDDHRLSQREIALELGTTRRTVEGWVRRADFQARLETLKQARRGRWEAEWQAQLAANHAQAARDIAEMDAATDRWLATYKAAQQARRQHRKLPDGAERRRR